MTDDASRPIIDTRTESNAAEIAYNAWVDDEGTEPIESAVTHGAFRAGWMAGRDWARRSSGDMS